MRTFRSRKLRFPTLSSFVLMAFMVVGCEDGKDGADGVNGANGADGNDGATGLHCWDFEYHGA